MKRSLFLKTYVLVLLGLFGWLSVITAQAPAQDIDSITEDSYQRMLNRKAAALKADSVRTAAAQIELTKSNFKNTKTPYYLLSGLVLLLAIFWFLGKVSKANINSKKQ